MKKQLVAVLSSFCFHWLGSSAANASVEACHFLPQEYSYEGSVVEQARCLLRQVSKGGRLQEQLMPLPSPLESLVGQPVSLDKQRFREYLEKAKILENQLGGSLDDGLSYANDGDINTRQASYFVIHDTSTPDYGKKAIPANINSAAWKYNQLWRYPEVGHVFINRLGESATKVNFNIPFRATKYESKVIQQPAKGLYLHIELLQPRRDQPKHYKKNNALIAPTPGFTLAQYKRLALVYTAASIRGGKWLIPTFHAVVDYGLFDAHDDPQNFSREQFALEVLRVLKSLNADEVKNIPLPAPKPSATPSSKKQKTPHRR